ncbi:uncharacterized protein METZ01_LOCUS163887 [marine metagenome]|uniref:ABC transporter domain-containing protein n=1 Tax=marine metagenome TaxID=408172 RepID=A0A382BCQ1_9ZZZZ
MSVIDLENVGKKYWPGPIHALSGVSLDVQEGEVVTLLGPSGCGKTTTLRLIAGFESPDEGTIRIRSLAVSGNGSWTPPENRGVGMLFQDYALFPHLRVGENVMFGLHHRPKSERAAQAKKVLDLLDLSHHFDRYPHELSGGQQQRVALARAIAPEPVVVLMDEPFSNLDAHLRDNVRDEVVASLRSAGITCILVSHDQRDALAVSDRIAVMNQGRIEQIGTPMDIYKQPESIFVATFVGRTNLLQGLIQGENGCVLTDFGSFCQVDRASLPDGVPVMVAVRPEGFELSEDGALKGAITSTTYTGNNIEAEVEVPTEAGGQRALTVHLPTNQAYTCGDRVSLALVSDYASIVRNSCQTLSLNSPDSE